MKITFSNRASLDVLGVHGASVMHEGVQRDCLTVLMDPSVVPLEQALAVFTPEACQQLTLEDESGSYVHEHYTVRLEAGCGFKDYVLNTGGTGDKQQVVFVKMARSTMAERTMQAQQETIDALVLSALEG